MTVSASSMAWAVYVICFYLSVKCRKRGNLSFILYLYYDSQFLQHSLVVADG